MNKLIFVGLSFLINSYVLLAQLDLKEIIKGNDFVGYLPENQRWNYDGTKIFFQANEEKLPSYSTYQFDLLKKEKKKLIGKESAESGILEYDYTQRTYANQFSIYGNTLVKLNKKTGEYQLIYQTDESIYNIQRISTYSSPRIGQIQKVVFQKGLNLYCYSEKNGFSSIVQLTSFQNGNAKDSKKDSTFLLKQQTELFQFVRDKNKRTEWNKSQESNLFQFPKAKYLGEGKPQPLQISENGKFIVIISSHNEEENSTVFEQFVTSDGYTKSIPARAK